jgi:hypothetical protein
LIKEAVMFQNRIFWAITLALSVSSLPAAVPAARGAGPDRSQSAAAKIEIKISGRVTDFSGNPVEGAQIELKDDHFKNAAAAVSGRDGRYEIKAAKGRYMALAAVKDYQVKSLEYWAWNVLAERDLEINPRYDRLEVYAINAWRPQGGYPSLMIYFRPMSFVKVVQKVTEAGGMEGLQKLPVIDIAPELSEAGIELSIDGKPAKVLQINKVREATGLAQYMFGYILQTPLPERRSDRDYALINIALHDPSTGERGEGCLFFRWPY